MQILLTLHRRDLAECCGPAIWQQPVAKLLGTPCIATVHAQMLDCSPLHALSDIGDKS